MIHICNLLLTRRCNLKCSYCALTKNYVNKPKAMDDASGIELIALDSLSKINVAFDHKKMLRDAGLVS